MLLAKSYCKAKLICPVRPVLNVSLDPKFPTNGLHVRVSDSRYKCAMILIQTLRYHSLDKLAVNSIRLLMIQGTRLRIVRGILSASERRRVAEPWKTSSYSFHFHIRL